MSLRHVRLSLPVTDDALASLRPGDVVTLDGVLYTGREGLYRRWLDEGHPPPVDLAALSNANFHCSPAATVEADGTARLGAVTATASFRFSKWLEPWFARSGCRLMIGKGGMSEADYARHFVPNRAVYLTTVGYGTGALLGRGVRRVRAVHWLAELGIAQAIWVLEVKDFGPFLVDCDLSGNSLFAAMDRRVSSRVVGLYAGLKSPTLGRYGEVIERERAIF
jgi:L(+)-tartrate dehydratase beta subunit